MALRVSSRAAALLLSRRERATLRAVQQADCVWMKGGSYLRAEKRPAHVVTVLRVAFPVLLALALRRPVVGVGHSVGPIEAGLPGAVLKWVLRRSWTVYPRDELSRDRLVALGATPGPVVPDCALGMTAEAGAITTGRLVVSVRPHPRSAAIEEALIALVTSGVIPRSDVVVAVNSSGPIEREDDTPIAAALAKRLERNGIRACVARPSTAAEAIELYGSAEFVIGMRMHATILARMGGAPAVPIEYQGIKAEGVYRYLAPSVPILDAMELTPDGLIGAVESYICCRDACQEAANVERARVMLRAVFADILSRLDSVPSPPDGRRSAR